MANEARLLRQHKGRLEARMQILEDHNRQLEAQLQRLRQLLDEVSICTVELSAISFNSATKHVCPCLPMDGLHSTDYIRFALLEFAVV